MKIIDYIDFDNYCRIYLIILFIVLEFILFFGFAINTIYKIIVGY